MDLMPCRKPQAETLHVPRLCARLSTALPRAAARPHGLIPNGDEEGGGRSEGPARFGELACGGFGLLEAESEVGKHFFARRKRT